MPLGRSRLKRAGMGLPDHNPTLDRRRLEIQKLQQDNPQASDVSPEVKKFVGGMVSFYGSIASGISKKLKSKDGQSHGEGVQQTSGATDAIGFKGDED